MSNLGRGRVLRASVQSPTYSANYYDPRGPQEHIFPLPSVPYLKLAAVHDDKAWTVTVFALNRNLTEPLSLDLTISGFGGLEVVLATELRHDDLKAINTKATPDNVSLTPLVGVKVDGEKVAATLAPASWNVLRFSSKI